MQQFKEKYFILDKPNSTFWSKLAHFTKAIVLFPKWFLSLIFSRLVTVIALNPNDIRKQKPIHLVNISNEKDANNAVVINVLPKESFKFIKDLLLKINSSIINLPFMAKILKRELSFKSHKDKTYIDQVVTEVALLLNGKSKSDKCKDKKFAIENIHLKGLEGLDKPLKNYLLSQLQEKYGTDFIKRPRAIKLDFYTLETADLAVLDSVEVSTEQEKNKALTERKFVICCLARDQNYIHWIKDFNESAHKIGCTLIGFNYRGVDYSKGMVWTGDNMVDDALSQARRLINLGVKPENIAFEGTSLGGAIATLAAAKMHEQGLKVSLYNERSFRSLARLITGYILPAKNSNPWAPLNWLKYAAFGLTYAFIAPLIWIVGWRLNASSAWDKIPNAYKDFSVVRAPENNDEIIHDSWASIASYIDEHQQHINTKSQTGQPLTKEEQEIKTDKTERHHFKLNKNNQENTNPSPHSAPRRFLHHVAETTKTMHDFMAETLKTKLKI